MKNLFCSHTPSEENIKEVANELGLFQNVHLLACDINDVKVILNGATNYIWLKAWAMVPGVYPMHWKML